MDPLQGRGSRAAALTSLRGEHVVNSRTAVAATFLVLASALLLGVSYQSAEQGVPDGAELHLIPVEDPAGGEYASVSPEELDGFPELRSALNRAESEPDHRLAADSPVSAALRVGEEFYRVQAVPGGAAPLPESAGPALRSTLADRLSSASTETNVVLIATAETLDPLERMAQSNETLRTDGVAFRAEPFSRLSVEWLRYPPRHVDLAGTGPGYGVLRDAADRCISSPPSEVCATEITGEERAAVERLMGGRNGSVVQRGDRYFEVRIAVQ